MIDTNAVDWRETVREEYIKEVMTPEAVVVESGSDDDDEYELEKEPDPPITTGQALNKLDQLQLFAYQQNDTGTCTINRGGHQQSRDN